MPPVGFELTISAGERPQTYALDRAATQGKVITALNLSLIFHSGFVLKNPLLGNTEIQNCFLTRPVYTRIPTILFVFYW
jgi:hypothetical protein